MFVILDGVHNCAAFSGYFLLPKHDVGLPNNGFEMEEGMKKCCQDTSAYVHLAKTFVHRDVCLQEKDVSELYPG